MLQNRSGVLAAGHFIVDHVNVLDHWPEQDALATIGAEKRGSGGGAFNCVVDLSRLRAPFPLSAAGLIGDDEMGRWVQAECRAAGIDSTQLRTTHSAPTSHTLVMTVQSTGRRTFFHQPGANAEFGSEHVPFDSTTARILHFGYVGLLRGFDEPENAGNAYARLFAAASERGLRTSADLVSNPKSDLPRLLGPAFGDIDWLFGNEYEIARAASLAPPGTDPAERIRVSLEAGRRLIAAGVRQAVITHFPEGVVAVTRDGHHVQPAVNMPTERIRGTAGAGDAFAAGALLGLHEGWTLPKALELGVCAAATCLENETCSASIRPWKECLELGRSLGWRELPDTLPPE
jgi:sugar/nucleoside kinase (ribokinase family)